MGGDVDRLLFDELTRRELTRPYLQCDFLFPLYSLKEDTITKGLDRSKSYSVLSCVYFPKKRV